MKALTLRYSGDTLDDVGMPVSFNSYYVVAGPGPQGGAVADVVTIAGDEPGERHFEAGGGGEDAALKAAENFLDRMNATLEKQLG